MGLTKIGKKPQNKYNLGDKVRHTNNPDIVYVVQKIFADGSYRIVPLNADLNQAITFATENCMSLYDEHFVNSKIVNQGTMDKETLARAKELETLGYGRKTDAVDDAEEEVEIPVMPTGVCNKPHEATWKDCAVRTIDRLISWMLYSMTFCFLFIVAGLELSAREIIAYSLMLGLVVGSINNIERVMRELFRKED